MLECLVRAGIHEAIWVDLTDRISASQRFVSSCRGLKGLPHPSVVVMCLEHGLGSDKRVCYDKQ